MTSGTDSKAKMRPDAPDNRGLYLFLVRRRKPLRIKVGALGWCDFGAGWYIYTGRARRSLIKRVQRHWLSRKRLRWHIDYLSSAPGSEPIGAVLLTDAAHDFLDECWINQRVGALLDAQAVMPGFGASDCMSGCPAHLWYLPQAVSLLEVARISPGAVLLLPRDGGRVRNLTRAGLLPAAGDSKPTTTSNTGATDDEPVAERDPAGEDQSFD